jgi:hypothetical protein
MRGVHGDLKSSAGATVDYIGMVFNLYAYSDVSVTMDVCVTDILCGSGVVITSRSIPATEELYTIRSSFKSEVVPKQSGKYAQCVLEHGGRARCIYVVLFWDKVMIHQANMSY